MKSDASRRRAWLSGRDATYRTEARREWHDYHLHHIRLRKDMFTSEVKVLTEEGVPEKTAVDQINGVFERAGLEIAIRNFWRLPVLATEKFFMGHDEPPAPGFFDYAIRGQLRALYLVNGGKHALEFSRLLWGVPLANMEEARPFLETKYDVSVGKNLNGFLDDFVKAELYPVILMKMPGSPLPGLPWIYVFALIGAICLILRDRPVTGPQLIWFLFLCSLFVVLMVTGNVRARYRIIFEPFWFIYLFGLLDSLVALGQRALEIAAAARSTDAVSGWLDRAGAFALLHGEILFG